MMVDVIEVFGSNFIIVDPEDSGPDPENPENSEDPEDSVNSRKFGEFITDLFQRIYIYDYAGLFFFSSINTMITIRIDSNDRFFNTRKNRPFPDLIEK